MTEEVLPAPSPAHKRKGSIVAERETWPAWALKALMAAFALLVAVVGWLFTNWMTAVASNVEKLANGQDTMRTENKIAYDTAIHAVQDVAGNLRATDAAHAERLTALEVGAKAIYERFDRTDRALDRIERKLDK
jgi:hypothetical protein